MIPLLVVFAIVVGSLMPIQAGVNAELSRVIKNAYLGAFLSFFIGAVAMGLLTFTQKGMVSQLRALPGLPPYLLTGGVMGALFVATSIFLIPKLGATTMIAAFVTGQLLMSLAMDHFGILGVPVQTVGPHRLVGIVLLFIGLFLVVKRQL
jgi:transporter family-2 protein